MENSSQSSGADQMNAAIPEGADLPSLDDPQEVNYLLYSHALAAANRLSEAARKHVSRQEVIDVDKKASAFLASALLGKNPAYAPAKVNTPETIERRLRSALSNRLSQVGLTEQDVVDSRDFMQVAMFMCTNEVHELIQEIEKNPDTIVEEGPIKLNALLGKWVQLITKEHLDA